MQWVTLVSSGSTAKEPPGRAVAGRPGGAAVNCHSLTVRSSLTMDPFQASCHGVLRSFSLRDEMFKGAGTQRPQAAILNPSRFGSGARAGVREVDPTGTKPTCPLLSPSHLSSRAHTALATPGAVAPCDVASRQPLPASSASTRLFAPWPSKVGRPPASMLALWVARMVRRRPRGGVMQQPRCGHVHARARDLRATRA